MAVGGAHSCVITVTGGAARCWGRNTDGEVGDGTTSNPMGPGLRYADRRGGPPGRRTPPLGLTVWRSGTGSGEVSSTPQGIACGTDCFHAYGVGTPVTLSAVASAGSVFVGWTGACSGTAGCVLTMDGVKGVTASFAPATGLTVSRGGISIRAGHQRPGGHRLRDRLRRGFLSRDARYAHRDAVSRLGVRRMDGCVPRQWHVSRHRRPGAHRAGDVHPHASTVHALPGGRGDVGLLRHAAGAAQPDGHGRHGAAALPARRRRSRPRTLGAGADARDGGSPHDTRQRLGGVLDDDRVGRTCWSSTAR